MSSDKLPEPLVSAEIDISKLDGFMLDTVRLLGSELVALSTGEEFKAAVLLWCRAWKQTPPCSLPADDRVLASFAMVPPNRWSKVKGMALRGFVTCSDGRLYHKVLAADCLRAWEALTKRRDRTKAATEARMRVSQNERDEERNVQRDDTTSRQRNVDRNDQRNEVPTVARDGTGRDGTGRKKSTAHQPPSSLPREASDPGEIPPALRREPTRGRAETVPQSAALLEEKPRESPENRLIAAFDEACRAAWPEAHRGYPAATDGVIAQRWLEAGADPALVAGVARAVLVKRAAKGRTCPSALAFLDEPIREALAARKAGGSSSVNGHADAGYTGPNLSEEMRAHFAKTDPEYLADLDRRQGRAP